MCSCSRIRENSSKRETHLKSKREFTENENRGVHAFCPTRWTIRGESCQAMLDNYDELMELWDWVLANVKDTEMKARIRGVQSYMRQFKFIFGCRLGKMLLTQTDNLSRTLQDSSITAAEGQGAAMSTVSVLEKSRNDESFQRFWSIVNVDKERLDVEDPVQPRKRKAPARYETGTVGTGYFAQSKEDLFKAMYYDALDNAIEGIKARFEQSDWLVYKNIQEVILRSLRGDKFSEELNAVGET